MCVVDVREMQHLVVVPSPVPGTENHKCEHHGGTKREVSGSPQSLGFIVCGALISVQHFVAEIFEKLE